MTNTSRDDLERWENASREARTVLERAMNRLRAQSEREKALEAKRRERLRRWSFGLLGREQAS